jgi:protein MpaA
MPAMATTPGSSLNDGWRDEIVGASRTGLPLRAFLPSGDGPSGLLLAGMHGEEPETLLLARRLLERVGGDATGWVVLPCANPDGVLAGTRQNGAGVDVNRNFPASTWSPDVSYTFPPGCTDRRLANRTNASSPGPEPGSEPETQALMRLVERLEPALVVDLHSPLEVILDLAGEGSPVADALGRAAGLRVAESLSVAAPGTLADWAIEQGFPTLVYEVEHAPLPALCERHLPGLEALLRGELG